MVFIPGSIANKTRTKTPTTTGGFVPGSIAGTSSRISSKRLQTSRGLYDLAVQSGYKNDADRILANQEGENAREIFSGGFISDVFDVLNAFQYGTVGLLKGKSFSEGVRTRQSFSDKDALGDKGIPGIIMGTLLDIAFDPLTYLAPATIARKVPGLIKGLKAGKQAVFGKQVTKAIKGTEKTFQSLEGGTRAGKYLASKFVWMHGADPIYRETFERGTKNIAITSKAVSNLGKTVAGLNPAIAAKILKKDATGRFVRVRIEELSKVLKPDELEPVAALYSKIDSLGQEAVNLGLLSKGKFEENFGTYLKTAFEEFEIGKKAGFFGVGKVGIKGIKKRKVVGDVSEFGLTQIENPAYLLFKSAFDLSKDVENAKILRKVNNFFGTTVKQDGFKLIPKTQKWGDLGGKYIPNNMQEYLTEIINPGKDTIAKNLVANFKFFKVVMNPATHARNIVSNKLLNWWKLGMNPLDPRVIKTDTIALKEISKGTGKWMKEATPLGYGLDTFAAAEMKTIITGPEFTKWGKGKKLWKQTKEKLGNIYQGEENFAKLSSYIFNRTNRGMDGVTAWKAAESATFNYAQVTPFIRKLRESLFGFPFITFTVKATPIAIETAVKAPHRISVLGKIKQNIEKLSDTEETARERASEPGWIKDGFYVKLPMKDRDGRSAYFDMTYILPFGDIVSGNFFERSTDRETGLQESQVEAFAKNSPFIQVISALGKNQDFFGNKIWKDSDTSEKQVKDMMIYLTKVYVPPLIGDQLPGGYNTKGERTFRGFKGATQASSENQRRNLTQELLRTVGAKIQPIDVDIQESFQEWNKKKALESLLREKGTGQYFNRFYIPRED